MTYLSSKPRGGCSTVTYISVAGSFFLLLCGRLLGFELAGVVNSALTDRHQPDEILLPMDAETERDVNLVFEDAKVQTTDGRMASIVTGGTYHVFSSMKVEGSLRVDEKYSVRQTVIKIYSFGFLLRNICLEPEGVENIGDGQKRLIFSAVEYLPGGSNILVTKAVVEVHVNRKKITRTLDGPITFSTQ